MHKNRKCGFSLAEAMITILIIGILALLSVPVAKKIVKKDSNPNKGIWMATRNSNGEAVYWKKGMGNKDNPDKWTKCNTTCEINGQAVNDCCVFESPLNIRNFSLTAVGGGGSGRRAYLSNLEYDGAKESESAFRVKYTGRYKMLAIGGGGGAGRWNCDASSERNAGSGGTGALAYAEFILDDTVKEIHMTRGIGGTSVSGEYNGTEGGASTISALYTSGETKTLIKANGGAGGEGRWHVCSWRVGKKNVKGQGRGYGGGTAEINGGSNHITEQVNGIDRTLTCAHHSKEKLDAVEEALGGIAFNDYYIGTTYYPCQYPGSSGAADHTDMWDWPKGTIATPYAKSGVVIVTADIASSGEGGEAASAGEEFVPKFDTGQVVVYIGKGGKSGSIGSENGGDTYVGSKIYPGGKGGEDKKKVAVESSFAGGNGDASPIPSRNKSIALGGLADKNGNLDPNSTEVNGADAVGYGAGGGGGGVFVDSSGKATAGLGGDGAPGYVEIKW